MRRGFVPPPAGSPQPRIPTQGGTKSTPQYLNETRFCATPAPGHPDPNARRVATWGSHGASMGLHAAARTPRSLLAAPRTSPGPYPQPTPVHRWEIGGLFFIPLFKGPHTGATYSGVAWTGLGMGTASVFTTQTPLRHEACASGCVRASPHVRRDRRRNAAGARRAEAMVAQSPRFTPRPGGGSSIHVVAPELRPGVTRAAGWRARSDGTA